MYKVFLIPFFLLLTNSFAFEFEPIIIESSKLDNNSTFDLPLSVYKLDQKKIETFQISSVEELSSVVSNANISGIGNRSDKTFTIRGISNYVTYESSVAMYVDDVPVPFSYGYGAIDFHNIKSIEVLKGPQCTQFGKGAESGVINIYTMQPTSEFKSKTFTV